MGQEGEGRDLTVTRQRVVVDPPDATEAVAELVRVAFGLVAVGIGVALRTLEPAPASPTRTVRGSRLPAYEVADAVLGTAWGAARVTGRVASAGGRVVGPVVTVVLRPPLLPRRLQPGRAVAMVAEQWRRDRPDTVRALAQWSTTMLPSGIRAALRQVDVQACVDAVLDSVDLDAVVAGVVRRMDVDAAVDLVLARLDLDAVSSAALDQVDLNQLVLDRIDLGRVIDAALQQVDLTQVVMEQVDLVAVAEYVVAAIDLPEIIRASTGSMASETVRGLRMQGVGADQAVTRVVDRLRSRRSNRRPAADALPRQEPRAEDPEDRP
jgi:uncharacterized protein YoaH (UPF0181 family)